jgi:hypothetical protein
MTRPSRGELLADLADMIRELTEPRTHTEMRDDVQIGAGNKRTRVRQPHPTVHPSLMQELLNAMTPGADGDAMGTGGYESRPSADLEPLRVWVMIRDQSAAWCTDLGVSAKTVTGGLTALVSAHHTDSQLDLIVQACRSWVRQAKRATGWEAQPITLGDECPECHRRNTLTVSGDLKYVRCNRCQRDWPEELIGILGQMLEQNRTQETVGYRCPVPPCYLVEGHTEEHRSSTGRYWPNQSEDNPDRMAM